MANENEQRKKAVRYLLLLLPPHGNDKPLMRFAREFSCETRKSSRVSMQLKG
jgi:hypothetical protein